MAHVNPDQFGYDNLYYGPHGQTISGSQIQLDPDQYDYATSTLQPISGTSSGSLDLIQSYCVHGYISGTCYACNWTSGPSLIQDGVLTQLVTNVAADTDNRIKALEEQAENLRKTLEQTAQTAQDAIADLKRELKNSRKAMAKVLCERKPKPPEPDYVKHGQRVWLKSTGAGPFVTIRQIPVKVGSTATAVGWAIRDTKGKFHEAPDEDLTPHSPVMVRRPRKWATPLNIVSLIAVAQAAYIVWGFLSGV